MYYVHPVAVDLLSQINPDIHLDNENKVVKHHLTFFFNSSSIYICSNDDNFINEIK